MPLNYNVKQTDTGAGGGYNTAFTIKPPKKKNLSGVHPDLQTLFNEVVKHFDCTVVSGFRSQEEQEALYAKGRTVPGKIVTHMDGVERRSKHQTGNAVDVVPYPIAWGDVARFKQFGWFVKGVAATLKRYGAIDSEIEWGGDWTRFVDRPHFQIKGT